MNIIEKILSFLNKPTHYLFVGLTFSCWAFFVEKNSTGTNMFIGIVLLSLAFAFFVEWCFKNLQVFLKHQKRKVKIIQMYKEAQFHEKDILDFCLENNTLTYTTSPFEEDIINAIKSLSFKDLGMSYGQGTAFALYADALEILKKEKIKNAK